MKITTELLKSKNACAAGRRIESGGGIEAGWCIESGGGIEAGEGIEAGSGIKAGRGFGIFAGIRVRIKDWGLYARVTANTKPENLISGTWTTRDEQRKSVA